MKIAQNKNTLEQGFTLIELLVVIGILAVLLAIVLIAINPARQFKQANDTKRRSDVTAILNAIDQYGADNHGTLPGTITSTATNISKAGIDLCDSLVTQYIAALPTDPTTGTDGTTVGKAVNKAACAATYDTGYQVTVASGGDNRVTVSAVGELDTAISVTR